MNLSGEELVLLGAAAAIQLAQGKCAEELTQLGLFFTILGDNLSLLALSAPSQEGLSPSDKPAVPPCGPRPGPGRTATGR